MLDDLVVLLQPGHDGRGEEVAASPTAVAAGHHLGVLRAAARRKPSTRSSWFGLFSGPRSASAHVEPADLLAARLLGQRRDEVGRATPRPASTRVAAVQSCPALKKPAPAIPAAAASRSASSHTMTGALPPSSRCTRFRSVGRGPATSMPARTLPVIDTRPGVGCATSARPLSRSPHTTLNTPGRQELGRELGEHHRGLRRGLGGLEHDRVARREGGRDLPDRHHQRVVPRRHLRDDADRLAPDERRVARHVLARGAALEHARRAGEEPDLVDRGRDLLGGHQRLGLAGVAALGVDDVVGVALERVGDPQQREAALRRGAVAPAVERGRRRPHGRVDVGGRTPGPGRRSRRCTGRPAAWWRRRGRRPTCRSRSSARSSIVSPPPRILCDELRRDRLSSQVIQLLSLLIPTKSVDKKAT